MEIREVQDSGNTRWQCVEALIGDSTSSEKTTVVCTPTGGAQTVRLQLPKNWIDSVSDDELIRRIEESRT